MRRALAAALLGISLWIGSLAWTGFLMTRTVLDPDRSEAVADALLEDPAVRAQLEANIAGGVAAALPPGVPVDRAAIDAGAATALDSPAVEALFRDALVRTHQAFLGEGDPPRSIDGGAFGAPARDALVEQRPELDGVLPEAPAVAVPLPTERVPDLGPVREAVVGLVPVLAAVAAAGTVLALVVGRDRPRIVRRAGFWAIGLSMFVLVLAYGVPALAHRFAPDQAAVVAALVTALAESARTPAVVLFGAGVAAIVVSLLWRAAPALAPETVPSAPHRTRGSSPKLRPVARARASSRAVQGPAWPPAAPTGGPGRTRVQGAPIDATRVGTGPVDATRVEPAVVEATRVEGPPAAGRARPGARWVDGVGWVHEGPDPVPAGARWVVGVGYVLGD